MSLLFDQNISPRIVKEDASDILIFEFARKNNLVVVTFDSDFVDLNVVRGIPPKIIWIRTGNLTTRAVADLLNRNIESLSRFLESDQPAHQILEIIQDDR